MIFHLFFITTNERYSTTYNILKYAVLVYINIFHLILVNGSNDFHEIFYAEDFGDD